MISLRQLVGGRFGLSLPEPCHVQGFGTPKDFHQDKEQRACLPPKRVCTGGTNFQTVSQLAVSGLLQEAPSPEFIFCFLVLFEFVVVVGFFSLRIMLLVLSSISCFLCWQLPCYHRYTATALGCISPCVCHIRPQGNPWGHTQFNF